MAKSKFEYVKKFEATDTCLPNTWIVIRIDGKGFHRFSEVHKMSKPNDLRGLQLMNKAATCVLGCNSDIVLAYGQSDEYSFVLKKNTNMYNRRASKLMTTIVSLFASSYVFHWRSFFKDTDLQYPPAFDARVVLYPSDHNLRDYLSWRQADAHINNLYNTCFWKLVQESEMTCNEAQNKLKGTDSAQKNEILFQMFACNYNDEPEIFKKGTILIRIKKLPDNDTTQEEEDSSSVKRSKREIQIVPLHSDLIKDKFWTDYPFILIGK